MVHPYSVPAGKCGRNICDRGILQGIDQQPLGIDTEPVKSAGLSYADRFFEKAVICRQRPVQRFQYFHADHLGGRFFKRETAPYTPG